jgi:hypothetical protein
MPSLPIFGSAKHPHPDEIAHHRGLRPTARMSLAEAKEFAESEGQETLIALLTATKMAAERRNGISE